MACSGTRGPLAELMHHLITRELLVLLDRGTCNTDGSLTLSAALCEELRQRVTTPYRSLDEAGREPALRQADRVIALILGPESD